MERDFRSMYANGEYSPADPYLTGFTFQLVNHNPERALLSSLDHFPSSTPEDVTPGDLQANARGKQVAVHREMKSCDFMETETRLIKMPKCEPSPELTFPYGFVSSKTSFPASNSFGQLPELRSFEHANNYAVTKSSSEEPSRKRSEPSLSESHSPATDAYLLASLLKRFEFANNTAAPVNLSPSPADLARKRRYTLSEKTRSLAKLLPWDKKMDSATMLEEAHKYIKFLQAQISVLHSMPGASHFSTENPSAFNHSGALGMLNRQQLLQVLVNSPVAQTAMYSRGLCVYSIEQLRSIVLSSPKSW